MSGVEPTCEFYVWIGGAYCDRCGKEPREHRGFQVMHRSASPLGSGVKFMNLTWAEYDDYLAEQERIRKARRRVAELSDDQAVHLAAVLEPKGER